MKFDQHFHYQMAYAKQRRDMSRRPTRPARFPEWRSKETELGDDMLPLDLPLGAVLGGSVQYQQRHDLRAVGTAAHRAAAISRYEPGDPYPVHRPSPAPRCMYTSTLYWLSSGELLPRDLYLYHPLRHSLSPCHCPAGVLDMLPPHGWLVTLDTRRLAFKYADFAERLGRIEAGHLSAQVRACLSGLGWASNWEVLSGSALAWRPAEYEQPAVLITYDPVLPPVTHDWANSSAIQPVSASPELARSFEACVRERESGYGPSGVHPQRRTVPQRQPQQMAQVGLDDPTLPQAAEFGLRAVVLNVETLTPGVYEFNRLGQAHWHSDLPHDSALFRDLFLGSGFITRHCCVIWFITANVAQAFATYGDAAYSALMVGAGHIAQRMELCAAAYTQFARPSMNYDEAGMDYHLGCATTPHTVICQLLVGQNRADALSFSLSL